MLPILVDFCHKKNISYTTLKRHHSVLVLRSKDSQGWRHTWLLLHQMKVVWHVCTDLTLLRGQMWRIWRWNMPSHPTPPEIHVKLRKQLKISAEENKRCVPDSARQNHRSWKAKLLIQLSTCYAQTNQPIRYAASSTLLRFWKKYGDCIEKKIEDQIMPSTPMWKVLMMLRCLFLTDGCTWLRNSLTSVWLLL